MDRPDVIYEHAHLNINIKEADAFEAAFASARHFLESAPGCRSVDLLRSIDQPTTYLLKVGWDRIEDHLDIFPKTENARNFGEAIAGYFQTDPLVVHFSG
ncbi:heme-degrading monooxygenase HmoA [Arthrobacter bambusae]|uniref:Heme-degrading monooxygenase HmoA n=1 Tax=Arthrobacter bambusae TaxID=1338426 RepID=A0ABV2P170_9MICC